MSIRTNLRSLLLTSTRSVGLRQSEEAPIKVIGTPLCKKIYTGADQPTTKTYVHMFAQFQEFIEGLLADWDMEVLCTAHNGACYSKASERPQKLSMIQSPNLQKNP